MKSLHALPALTALSLLLCMPSAHADPHYARAAASLNNLSVTWDDLDAEDGAVAGVWLNPGPSSASTAAGWRDDTWHWQTQYDQLGSHGMVLDFGEIHNTVEPLSLASSASVTLPDSALFGTTRLSYSYFVSQYTMVNIQGDTFSDVAHAGVGSARTEIVMNLYMGGELRSTSTVVNDGGLASLPLGGYFATSNEGFGELEILIKTTAATALLPVPEPHSYAMMFAGFAVLAGAVRRRKSGHAA